MSAQPIELIAAGLFAVALLHTSRPSRSIDSRIGIRATPACSIYWAKSRWCSASESRRYAEPLFVFVVMVIAGSRPVLETVRRVVDAAVTLLPLPAPLAASWLGLAAVPLAGSLITEPAAMTIAALMLSPLIFRPGVPEAQQYFALGVLFVNVSIGGTLTSYAAPPVLMVASTWSWDSAYMPSTFGWKAALAVLVNASAAVFVLRNHLTTPPEPQAADASPPARVPLPVALVHLVLLGGVVLLAHHPVAFLGLFLLFLGFAQAYERYQDPLLLKEALLVGFFLAGLVVLGGLQRWWVQPIVSALEPLALFFAALGLTALGPTVVAATAYLVL